MDDIAAAVARRAGTEWTISPRRVINGTGTILHTNFGRAPLSKAAQAAMIAAADYSDLEYDLGTGKRGSRQDHIEPLVTALIEAEAAMMVGNNAGAVLLSLSALTKRREVVVSRGQAVEIGGGFRVPDIMLQSGAKLVEVGTTNRTRIADYADAIHERTAAILHVHPSNFAITGFTETVSLPDLVRLARSRGTLLLVDNGSGALIATEQFGLAHEPMPREALASGADLVMFSTDKLLGGPQGGIVAGKRDLVTRLKRHPLARSLRADKTVVAGLAATLMQYLSRDTANIPVLAMLSKSEHQLRSDAESLVAALESTGVRVGLQPGRSTVGGGSLPTETLPTWLVWLQPAVSVASFVRLLRSAPVPVIGRVSAGRFLLDPRTLLSGDGADLIITVRNALASSRSRDALHDSRCP